MYGIIGAGRGCYEIIDLINFSQPNPSVTEIWDDIKGPQTDLKTKIQIINKINPELYYIISPGDPRIRKILYNKTKREAKYIQAVVGKNVHAGSRVIYGEGLILQNDATLACDSKVGKHVFINFKAGIGHDSNIGDLCFIGAMVDVMGYVKLGEGVMLGCGALILPDVEVGEWSKIGAGSVVTKNIPPYEVWVGNPAKFLRKNEVEFK